MRLLVVLWRAWRLARCGIRQIDRMDGRTFEEHLERLFRRLGWTVERTRYSGDFGADLVAVQGDERLVVQAKRSQSKIGVKAVQEAVAARGYYGCEQALVVTNNHFTRQAMELAEANGVELWDREALVQALVRSRRWWPWQRRKRADEPAPVEEPVTDVAPERDVCAVCGGPVSGRAKQFCQSSPRRFRGRLYCTEHQPLA